MNWYKIISNSKINNNKLNFNNRITRFNKIKASILVNYILRV